MSAGSLSSIKVTVGEQGPRTPFVVGRYVVYDEIAAGGMATVHLGRLLGSGGFARTVAIKRMHANLAKDPEFVAMFLDEAKLASRIGHPNVVATLDVVAEGGEALLVMEYVPGLSLHALLGTARREEDRVPLPILVRIIADALMGLHAAHEAMGEDGEPLGIVHRDVTPHNVLVDTSGVARVLDFGIAKASNRAQHTQEGTIKGKPAYMAPEQVTGEVEVDRRVDIYAACAILWEGVVGRKLHESNNGNMMETLYRITRGAISRPSAHGVDVPSALEDVILRGLATDPVDRFATAEALAEALEAAVTPAPRKVVADWLKARAGDTLSELAALVKQVEQAAITSPATSDVELALVDGGRAGSGRYGPRGAGAFDSTAQPYTLSGVTPIGRRGPDGEVAVDAPPMTSSRSIWGRRAAGAGLALALVGIGISVGRGPITRQEDRTAASTPAPSASALAMATPLPGPQVGTAMGNEASATTPAITTPTTTTSPSASPVGSTKLPAPSSPIRPKPVARPQSVPSARPTTAAAVVTAPRVDPCAVPFSVDERGIKHIKPECR